MNSISPLDGRYIKKVKSLQNYFSEKALICYRTYFEQEYLKYILPILRPDLEVNIVDTYNEEELFEQVKEIEKKTNHDVKAVECYLSYLYSEHNPEYIPYIHIGLTSADINSICRSQTVKLFINDKFISKVVKFIETLENISKNWNMPMLARTHGQPATPTNLMKEMMVYISRLKYQIIILNKIEHRTKFGGATGGFNALKFAYPNIKWDELLDKFCSNYGLIRNRITTQVDHFDNLSEIFDCIKRINTIMIDFCQDIWLYCMIDYFKLRIKVGEVGSSTMPHKVNPIDFENGEGNLKLSNCQLNFLSEKLPVSRLQRDLTDSTVTRNIGVAFGHSYLALKSTINGVKKLEPNADKIKGDLNNYAVLGEAVQTILRKDGNPNAYDTIKDKFRNNSVITADQYKATINSLEINEIDKDRLLNLTPHTY